MHTYTHTLIPIHAYLKVYYIFHIPVSEILELAHKVVESKPAGQAGGLEAQERADVTTPVRIPFATGEPQSFSLMAFN